MVLLCQSSHEAAVVVDVASSTAMIWDDRRLFREGVGEEDDGDIQFGAWSGWRKEGCALMDVLMALQPRALWLLGLRVGNL